MVPRLRLGTNRRIIAYILRLNTVTLSYSIMTNEYNDLFANSNRKRPLSFKGP